MDDPINERLQILHTRIEQEFLDALVDAEGKHRHLLDSISEIVFELDGSRCFRFLNRAWKEHTGRAIDHTLGAEFRTLVHADDRTLLTTLLDAGEERLPREIDLRIQHADGSAIWFSATLTVQGEGSDASWSGTLTNIDARKQAEAESARHATMLNAISRAQSAYIGKSDLSGILDSLFETGARVLETNFIHLIEANPIEVTNSLSLSLQPHAEWLKHLATTLEAILSEAPLEPSDSTIEGLSHSLPHTFFLTDEWATQLEFGPLPDPCRGAIALAFREEEHCSWFLLVGPSPHGFELVRGLLVPLVSTLQQLLRADRLRKARDADATDLERLSRVASQTSDCVILTDKAGRIQWVNEGFVRLTGYHLEEVLGMVPGTLLQGEDSCPQAIATMGAALADERPFEVELINYHKSQMPYFVKIRCNPMRDSQGKIVGYLAIESDVTREKELLNRIKADDHHKTILLKEIHHRVKNNLQIISSLLTLQSERMPSEESRTILQDSVLRVRSMALIHQHLYGVDALDRIDIGTYARDLSVSLRGLLAPTMRLEVHACRIDLGIHDAIPVGLILNELLTNAFKYGVSSTIAGTEGRHGRTGPNYDIRVEIVQEGSRLSLAVLDSGAGLGCDFDLQRPKSLGLHLVRALTRQLRGELTYDFDRGSRFTLNFPLPAGTDSSNS